MKNFNVKLAFFLILTSANCAIAGPPFVTDDPEPVDTQSWEVNYSVAKTWRNHGSSAGIPSIDINYGLTKDIQLHAQPKLALEIDSGQRKLGLDNTEIGVKYRFIDHGDEIDRLMVGIYPMLQLPTGDSSLGDSRGRTQLFLPIWIQYNSGKWTTYGGTGYRINNYPKSRNSIFVGITTLYQLTDNLSIGAELYRESETTQGDVRSSGFNLGGIYDLSSKYHLLVSSGRALNNVHETNDFSGFVALQVIY